jgi:lysophospholipase L1-like esterase
LPGPRAAHHAAPGRRVAIGAGRHLAPLGRLGYDPRVSMRLLRIGAATAGVILALVLLLELLFVLGGLLVRGEPTAAADGRIVVLCVGDSHTRGRKDPDNYPFQLERILNERTGKAYRVVNLGIPGQNTAQVRNRLERYLTYYRPAIVLHFGGVNNVWNHIETEVWHQSWMQRLVERSRVLRFGRVALFYGRLARDTYEPPAIKLKQWTQLDKSSYHVNFGGVEEDIATASTEGGARLPDDQYERVTYGDLTALMRTAADRRIPMFLVMYPLRDLVFEPVNRMVERVSAELGVPYVDSPAAVRALGDRRVEELYDSWAHPTPLLYGQIAEEAYALLVRQGLVAPAPTR